MEKIFGFSPEESRAALKKKLESETASLDDLFSFFEQWVRNIEQRVRAIEKSLKMEYPKGKSG